MTGNVKFADTSYWLVLSNSGDALHARVCLLADVLDATLVTTDLVLAELGNSMAARTRRLLGARAIRRILSDPDVCIIYVNSELLAKAVQLYEARPDKDWGLTDCVSFVVMEERGIEEALAADQHFIQAGFRALLLEAT
jgi:hypothetical protein